MSSYPSSRVGGIALAYGGLIAIGATLFKAVLTSGSFASPHVLTNISSLLRMAGAVILTIGLLAANTRLAPRSHTLCVVGVALLVFTLLGLDVVGSAFTIFGPTTLPKPLGLLFLVGGISGLVGSILLGIATFRSGSVPRWTAILLVIGGILSPVERSLNTIWPPLASVPVLCISLALAGMGFALWQSLTGSSTSSIVSNA
jgi:hypothetical protein